MGIRHDIADWTGRAMTQLTRTPGPITTFVVTDIEADGPSPLDSSMLSFASVACDVDGKVLDEFEAVLAPRADRKPHPVPWPGGQTQPEAWKHATEMPSRRRSVMPRYADWVEACPAFASLPPRR